MPSTRHNPPNQRNVRVYNRDKDYTIVQIPKKGRGFRKICIPSKELLKIQRASLRELNQELKRILKEDGISQVMHGFIPYRNSVSAAVQHIGYDCTIILDIKDFFDNCTKDMVQERLKPELVNDRFFDENGYLVQGFATSPVLANICLSKPMSNLKKLLDIMISDKFSLTCYADDIQISFNLKDEGFQLQNTVIKAVESTIEYAGFTIKSSKTRIRYAKYGFRRILGVNVGDTELQPSRKTRRKIRAARHQANWSSVGGLTTWSKCLLPLTEAQRNEKRSKTKGYRERPVDDLELPF